MKMEENKNELLTKNNLKKVTNFFELERSAIKVIRKRLFFLILEIILYIVGILLFVSQPILLLTEGNSYVDLIEVWVFILIMGLGLVLCAIGFVLELTRRQFKSTFISNVLEKINWLELYSRTLREYFENDEVEIYKINIFSNIQKYKNDANELEVNKIYAKYKNANLEFVIFQLSEYGKFFEWNSSLPKVYESLRIERSDLFFKNNISMQKNNLFSNLKNLKTESIAFDNFFQISCKDKIESKKIFSPKVIEDFEKIKLSKKFETVELDKDEIQVNFLWRKKTRCLDAELVTFRNHFTYRSFIYGIAKSVVIDIERLLDILEYAKPLL